MSEEAYDALMERHIKALAQSMKDCAAGFHRMQDEAIKLILKQAEERMNAPKQIWIDPKKAGGPWPSNDDVEYIRGDIAEEMWEALQEVDYVLDVMAPFGSDIQKKVKAAMRRWEEE